MLITHLSLQANTLTMITFWKNKVFILFYNNETKKIITYDLNILKIKTNLTAIWKEKFEKKKKKKLGNPM